MELMNETYIKNKLPREELLAGLAEEASELAQAALKYRRAIIGTNPTPMTENEARMSFIEELADASLYMSLLTPDKGEELVYMLDCAKHKEYRWVDRLKEASKRADS